jgi:hypothetical protein
MRCRWASHYFLGGMQYTRAKECGSRTQQSRVISENKCCLIRLDLPFEARRDTMTISTRDHTLLIADRRLPHSLTSMNDGDRDYLQQRYSARKTVQNANRLEINFCTANVDARRCKEPRLTNIAPAWTADSRLGDKLGDGSEDTVTHLDLS